MSGIFAIVFEIAIDYTCYLLIIVGSQEGSRSIPSNTLNNGYANQEFSSNPEGVHVLKI